MNKYPPPKSIVRGWIKSFEQDIKELLKQDEKIWREKYKNFVDDCKMAKIKYPKTLYMFKAQVISARFREIQRLNHYLKTGESYSIQYWS